MVETKNRYITLNVGQVSHFQTPKIHGNPSNHGGTLDGSRHFVHIFKVVDNVSYRGVLDPIYHRKPTFKLRSSNRMQFHHGKEHEWHPPIKNLRLGLWISLNLSLVSFPEIASLNSTLLKFLIAHDSGKQDLEKSRSSLKREKSQPNDFLNRWNLTNDFLFFSTVSKVIRNSGVKRSEPRRGSS
jgi:hypothetical protein